MSMRRLLVATATLGLLGLGCTDSRSTPTVPPGPLVLNLFIPAAQGAVPVNGIEVVTPLPQGLTVAADARGEIPAASLALGPDAPAVSMLAGRFEGGLLRVSLTNRAAAPWSGVFAKVTVQVQPGSRWTRTQLATALGWLLAQSTVVGVRPDNHDPVTLAVAPSLRLAEYGTIHP